MVLSLIKREIEKYKQVIVSPDYNEVYKWEALKNFQDNWDINATDFRSMYDISLYSKVSGNLWANPHWFPKAVMLDFIDHNTEKVREMFANLFNDDLNDVDNRINRFVHNCDVLREEVFESNNSMKSHFHDGQRMVSLYLAFRFPEKYAIYKFTEFKTFMEIVRATNTPGTGECGRFFKVVRTLNGILFQDAELIAIHRRLLTDESYNGETLMLAQDFIFRTARRYLPN